MAKFLRYAEYSAQACALLAGTIFLVSALIYLQLGHWQVTHLDYWRIYDICLNHSWLESALLKVNNHSLFFPSFIWLADLRFLHGNQNFIFYVGLVLLTLISGILATEIWRDRELNLSRKLAATLIILLGNFWMGRGSILSSGGFNCTASLSMVASLVACIQLTSMRGGPRQMFKASIVVLTGAFVASFSASIGLAAWPALLFLAWCLRLSWKSLMIVSVGMIIAGVIFFLLPSVTPLGAEVPKALPSLLPSAVGELCRLLGSPVLSAKLAWMPQSSLASADVAHSLFSLCFGAVGLLLFVLIAIYHLVRRNMPRNGAVFVSLALTTVNMLIIVLIVAGRTPLIQKIPTEVAAPRYFYWSSLFWSGLLLYGISLSTSRNGLSLPVLVMPMAILGFALPSHYQEGLRQRYAFCLARSAATGLVVGVHDNRAMAFLFRDPRQVYRVAKELRNRRLDMFAEGYQDWIGQKAAIIRGNQQQSERITGRCQAQTVRGENRVVRITGWVRKAKDNPPEIMLVIDSNGLVQGLARSCSINRTINRIFYLNTFSPFAVAGYIRDYDPSSTYALRSIKGGKLSEETIAIRPPKPVRGSDEGTNP